MTAETKNRYASIPKRSFRNSIIYHVENNYKLIGSHKVIQMMADDIVELHKEYYPETSTVGSGEVVWQTTSATEKKPSYGKHVEDQKIKTVILPLITPEDIEYRMRSHYQVESKGNNHKKQAERDVAVMARLIKSAFKQGGLLSGAELSVLMNRSLSAIGRYLKMYHETHADILPTKGIILDQGSRPTHKAPIVNLYEQGIPDPDIARLTNHTIESVGLYLRTYKNVKMLMEKGFNLMEMVRVSGKSKSTIIQYRDLVCQYQPELKCMNAKTEDNK
ncbi:MAG: DUF1670 domain-containing protein [Candidatus Marinimicrobia bacterium]|nr:DUF1670 domain-containing protein [Candidatus Neomarinimicrobiota bacterium]MCF7841087.1 DUF1670 domain-containing protein [Candidatus Neomarinimicrobiota bacterium]